MLDLALMARALDFIEAHLREPTGVGEMAADVSYSLYHFCRTFKAATHHTPYDYLMRRRIAEAARDVLQTQRKMIDIALDYQFSGPETFSRAFRRVMGLAPMQVRQRGRAGFRALMPRLTEAHLAHLQRGTPWHPAIEACPAFDLLGIVTLDQNPDVAFETTWAWLSREVTGVDVEAYFALTHCAAEDEPGAYMAAIDASARDTAGCALVTKTLPAQTYMRVRHTGTRQDVALTLDCVYHTWLPQSSYRAVQPWYVEHFGKHKPARETGTWDVYVPVEVVGN